MKITPKDYVDVKDDLAKAGFKAIKELTTEDKTFEEVATAFGVGERAVELVKTTSSYAEYETIYNLETEREDLQKQVDAAHVEHNKPRPPMWAIIASLIIVIGGVWLVVWLLIQLGSWVVGLF